MAFVTIVRRPGFDSNRVRDYNFYFGIGCVSFVFCFVGRDPDILLITNSVTAAFEYHLSSVLVHGLCFPSGVLSIGKFVLNSCPTQGQVKG